MWACDGGLHNWWCCGIHQGRPAVAAPRFDTVPVGHDAKQVRQNEPVLTGMQSDGTNNHAVDGGNYETHPMFAAHHEGRNDCKEAREII